MTLDSDVRRALYRSWGGKLTRLVVLGVGVWLKATGRLPTKTVNDLLWFLTKYPNAIGDAAITITTVWTAVQGWWSHVKLQRVKDAPAGKAIA